MKRKFKLLQDYPGCSIGVGDIIESHSTCPNLYTKSGNSFDIELVENYPEFWEEIKEKEYKILAFGFKNGYSRILNEKGEYVRVDKQEKRGLELEYLLSTLSDTTYYISSVKRLSDNTIFSIGDKIKTKDTKDKFQIVSFDIIENSMIIRSKSGISSPLFQIEHYKEPLFITEDGKAIYLGDDFYYVDPFWNCGKGKCSYNVFRPIEGYKQFSSLELGKEYIKENKPQYSKKDMITFGKTCFTQGTRKDYSSTIKTLLEEYTL